MKWKYISANEHNEMLQRDYKLTEEQVVNLRKEGTIIIGDITYILVDVK